MKRSRELERRIRAILPPAALAVGWLALWLLWPSPAATVLRRRSGTRVRISRGQSAASAIFRRPILFGRPSPFGFRLAEQKPAELSVLSHRLPLPPRVLPRSSTDVAATGDTEIAGEAERQVGYEPYFAPIDPFKDVLPVRGFYVQAFGALPERGFEFGPVPEALGCRTGEAWEVEMTVRLMPAGRVANIMIQDASADADTVRRAEQYVFTATGRVAETEAVGLVRVGCAKP